MQGCAIGRVVAPRLVELAPHFGRHFFRTGWNTGRHFFWRATGWNTAGGTTGGWATGGNTGWNTGPTTGGNARNTGTTGRNTGRHTTVSGGKDVENQKTVLPCSLSMVVP